LNILHQANIILSTQLSERFYCISNRSSCYYQSKKIWKLTTMQYLQRSTIILILHNIQHLQHQQFEHHYTKLVRIYYIQKRTAFPVVISEKL